MRPGKKLVFASLCHGGRERRKKTKVLKKRRETKHFVVSSRGTNSSRRRTHKIMKHEASASEGVPHTWLDPSPSPSLVSTERSEGRRNKKKCDFKRRSSKNAESSPKVICSLTRRGSQHEAFSQWHYRYYGRGRCVASLLLGFSFVSLQVRYISWEM